MTETLTVKAHPRVILEIAALTLLEYIEAEPDGFRILVRDSPVTQTTGGFASLISDVATHVEHILAAQMAARGFEPALAPLYSQALVGMIALTGQYWLDHRTVEKSVVAAHVVNLAWNGLTGLETKPGLSSEATDAVASRTRD
jgi:hypothetical protein